MREYGKLKTAFWRNPKIRGLTERARLLAAYMISCPHGNSAGCFVLPYGYVAEDLDWEIGTVRKVFAELLSIGFLDRDEPTALTRILPWWEHNTIENPNVAKNVIREMRSLPNCVLRQRLIDETRAFICVFETVAKLFDEAFRNREPSLARPEPDLKEIVGEQVADPPAPDSIDEAVKAYNDMAAELKLPKVDRLTAKRKSAARLRLDECGGIEGWRKVMGKIKASPFLRGENDRGWRVDFDFLMQPSKLLKILEGAYGQSPAATPPKVSFQVARDIARSTTATEPHHQRLASFRRDGFWPPLGGPKPGERGCTVPDELLTPAEVEAKHGRGAAA